MKTFIQFITEDDMARSAEASRKASKRVVEGEAVAGLESSAKTAIAANKGKPINIHVPVHGSKKIVKVQTYGIKHHNESSNKADISFIGQDERNNLHLSLKNGESMDQINHFGGVSHINNNEKHPGHSTIKEFKTRLQDNFTKYGPIGGAKAEHGGDGGRVHPKGHRYEGKRITRVGYMLDTSVKKDGTPNNPAHHQMVQEALYGKNAGKVKNHTIDNVHGILQGHAKGKGKNGIGEIDLKPMRHPKTKRILKGEYKLTGKFMPNGEIPTAGGHQHFAIFAKHEGPRTDDKDQKHGYPRRADLGVGVGLNGYHPYKGTMQTGPQFKQHKRGSGGSKVTIHHVDSVNHEKVHWLNPESVPHDLGGHKK